MDFDAVITGDRRIVARFDEMPRDIRSALVKRITKLTKRLYGRVRDLVPTDTGKLQKEIIWRVFSDPLKVKGVVMLQGGLTQSEYIKAAALEYGAHGAAHPRAYQRTITEAFGRGLAPTTIDVRAYDRVVNIEARLYMRSALADTEEEAVAELTEELNEQFKD
jgi:hypothetical protein